MNRNIKAFFIGVLSFFHGNMDAMVPLQYMYVPELTIENIKRDRYGDYEDQFIQYASKHFATIDPQIIVSLMNHFAYSAPFEFVRLFLKNFPVYTDKNQEPDKRDRNLKIFKAILIRMCGGFRSYYSVSKEEIALNNFADEIVKNSRTIDEAFPQAFIDCQPKGNIWKLELAVVNNLPTIDPAFIKNMFSIIKNRILLRKWILIYMSQSLLKLL